MSVVLGPVTSMPVITLLRDLAVTLCLGPCSMFKTSSHGRRGPSAVGSKAGESL